MEQLVQLPNSKHPHLRLPEWLRRKPGSSSETADVKALLRKGKLHTVCEEARCPNIAECFSRKTATFMILGDVCTRGCRFCSVLTGKPHFAASDFAREGRQVAETALQLGLKHIVVTSVARDDLSDGGASGFVQTIDAIRELIPAATIEVLIPDLQGKLESLQAIVEARPDVLNHNLETVPHLYRRVRPGSSYTRSLELLRRVKDLDDRVSTKTGIMLGLGETREEVEQVLRDSKEHLVDIFTAGQYMRPTRNHLPVQRYVPPEEFDSLADFARSLGIGSAFMGPLIRSSYHAGEVFAQTRPEVEEAVS